MKAKKQKIKRKMKIFERSSAFRRIVGGGWSPTHDVARMYRARKTSLAIEKQGRSFTLLESARKIQNSK